MKFNPKIHHRKSIRLKNYDYSQAGFYFITICCQNKKYLFGEIVGEKMILNNAGRMVEKWYWECENKFSDIQCHSMIVMPNHFHCIIQNVGADLRVCPKNTRVCPKNNRACPDNEKPHQPKMGEHIGSPLHRVVQWFKTMTTNEYIRGVKNNNWQRFDDKLWQRSFWEHIVRDENEHQQIAEYINNNPIQWDIDKLNNDYTNKIMEFKSQHSEFGACPKKEVWMV